MSKISLRKMKVTDRKYFAKWWRDKILLQLTSGIRRRISRQEVMQYFSAMLRSTKDYHWMIILNGRVMGHVSLSKSKNRWYEMRIVIGEKEHWNKGYGPRAIVLLLNKAQHLGRHKIYLEVRPDNVRAITAYEKCGFIKKGIQRYPESKYLPEILKMELKN